MLIDNRLAGDDLLQLFDVRRRDRAAVLVLELQRGEEIS
jgi:hypothetical protein